MILNVIAIGKTVFNYRVVFEAKQNCYSQFAYIGL